MCKLLSFQSAAGEKKILIFWKFTLLGLHYTSFRPPGPPAQDVRTQNLNISVSVLTAIASLKLRLILEQQLVKLSPSVCPATVQGNGSQHIYYAKRSLLW